ncbi:MAG: ribose-5-phosphate isomerase RpiA [Isosphaeraceae bacterium]|nr:ribose-5-phosphate isomerase RpiA [Isosphaeraceae bacterium]
MSQNDPVKYQAALAAVSLVRDGMIVGLGTGSTAAIAIELLGRRVVEQGLQIVGVPTSDESARAARNLGIRLTELNACVSIDLTIDGADQVDSQFRMIKGRGGALLREKLVAAASRRRIYIVGPEKRVDVLGRGCPVPVEAAAFDITHTAERLRNLGAKPRLRLGSDGNPVFSDGGNALIDCDFGELSDPEALDRGLQTTLGVFETGLFLEFCDTLIVGSATGAEVLERPSR